MRLLNKTKNWARGVLNKYGYELVTVPDYVLVLRQEHVYFARLYDSIRSIDGDIVECGVGRGHSLLSLVRLASREGRGRRIWGFDSFEGFPEPSVHDQSIRNPKKGNWNVSTPESITKLLAKHQLDLDKLTLVKGFFFESLKSYQGSSIALLHLDVDLYDSYKTCLEYFWPRITPGGVVLFDEYRGKGQFVKFPGAAKAIDEYFGEQNKFIRVDTSVERYYIYKQEAKTIAL